VRPADFGKDPKSEIKVNVRQVLKIQKQARGMCGSISPRGLSRMQAKKIEEQQEGKSLDIRASREDAGFKGLGESKTLKCRGRESPKQ